MLSYRRKIVRLIQASKLFLFFVDIIQAQLGRKLRNKIVMMKSLKERSV